VIRSEWPAGPGEPITGWDVMRGHGETAMAKMSLQDIAKKMRDIDFTMLSTHTGNGQIAARPMSNNRQVEYDGDSYFFSEGDTRTVADIGRNPKVGLSLQGSSGLLGMRPFMLSIEGEAELIRDKSRFKQHWTKDLDLWFENGIDTPGLVMIKVHAKRIHYWDGQDEGELVL
jgi:general stress protein 26